MAIPKVLPSSNVGVCLKQILHCASVDYLGESDSRQYNGFHNARLHTIVWSLALSPALVQEHIGLNRN